MKKSVAFYTLGCKLNFSETSSIGRSLVKDGYTKVSFEEGADVYVINTCSVTDNADKKCKKIVKEALRQNPQAFVAVIGCYAQLKPHEIAKIDGVDLVLGAAEKFNIGEYIQNTEKKAVAEVKEGKIKEVLDYHASYSIGDRTRTFLKVQDGCDYKCTYCTIPLARGISRSDALENVLKNASDIAKQGIKEIVLTGVNIGDYGKGEFGNKKHEHTFLDLVQSLDKVEGIERLRISSIEPNLLKNEIIKFVSSSRTFVPHFHIPLQSGSNDILKKMKRRYLREVYTERVNKIREVMPHACIGVDVIVGFPSEGDEEFKESVDFLHQLDISYLHVFTYSERANTKALEIKNIVPIHVRNERNKILRNLSYQKMQYFQASQLGKKRTVLFEQENKNGMMEGYTDNYLRITTPFREEWVNSEVMWEIRV
jgi:threonylcarbamoyladenosine tRNA methylthiotransferase MtaB